MITSFGSNDPQVVEVWSELVMRESLKKTLFNLFLGTGNGNIIRRLTDLESSGGDTIKFDLLMQMTGPGVAGDNSIWKNEEALVYHQDNVIIDQLRNAHAFRRMSQKRTLHKLRMDAKENLTDWLANKYDTIMFDYLCGNTARDWAGNAATAPDYDHYLMSGDVAKTGVIATDESSLGTNDKIQLADLDYAKEMAKVLTPCIKPVVIDGEEMYVFVMHPHTVTDLRQDFANSSYLAWPDIQADANKRGLTNPIFTGALGVYNGIILMESTRIYKPSSTVARSVFLGEDAGVFATGGYMEPDSNNLMSWHEHCDDYGNEKGCSVGSIFGMKSTEYGDKDYAKIVVSSYSASHSLI